MAKRLILIDGVPDGGQRDVRHALEDVLGDFSYVNMTPHGEILHAYQYFDAIKPALLEKQNVIIEHSWIENNNFEFAERQMLERAALSCGMVHVICRPGMYRGAPDDLRRPDRILGTNYEAVLFDRDSMLHTDTRRFVQQFVLPALELSPLAPSPYIGLWEERAIALIGDKPKFKGFQVPYISFRQDGVSWWLADGMARAGLKEKYFVWVNCQDVDGVETDPEPLIRLKPTICMAMSESAAAWCQRYDPDLIYTEHKPPVVWKNQHKGRMYPLLVDCKKLVEAMR